MNIFDQNLETLIKRYPSLAERVLTFPDKANLVAFEAKDGGLAYALRKGNGVEYLTDPVTPVSRIGNQLQANSVKLSDFTLPVMVIGTYPGDEILYLFDLCEKATTPHAAQKLYVCIDSLPCFCAFLQTMDAIRVIQSDRVKFFWHEDAEALANEFRQKPELSYLFTLVSGALNGSINKAMKPFISLVQERSAETQRLMAENETYYDAISDKELAERIEASSQKSVTGSQDESADTSSGSSSESPRHSNGQTGATPDHFVHSVKNLYPQSSFDNRNSAIMSRVPRLMTLTSSWSSVTQYGARDLCETMESMGWHTRKLNVDGTPTAHYIAKQINEFKPDIFVFINHLRTECPALFPKSMMFITWLQDTVPLINNHESAQKWNEMVLGKKSEVSSQKSVASSQEKEIQVKGNKENKVHKSPLLTSLPSVNSSFDPVSGSSSNHSVNSVKESSPQSEFGNHHSAIVSKHPVRKRDLIIGYVGQLKKYGYLEDRLVEMPMIVNTNIFKPRVLTAEQKAKYGCDIMFASNSSMPTERIVREILVPEFAGLKAADRRQESVASSQEKEIQTKGNKVQDPPSLPLRPSVHDSGLRSQPSSLFDESLLMAIHDHLWEQYRAEKTFTSYQDLEHELRTSSLPQPFVNFACPELRRRIAFNGTP